MSQIAIDGPAGAGKSTAAKAVSKRLGFMYVDTGAMYRTIALECLDCGVNVLNEEAVSKICGVSEIKIKYIDGIQHMYIADEDVSERIRKEEAGKAASAVAKYAAVREKLVELQKKLGEEYDVVMDGRDIGSGVLTGAELKIFLTASSECRAKRRYEELSQKGEACDFDTIRKDIEQRDYEDSHRALSPLKKAEDAIEIDTSDMGADEVAEMILKEWAAALSR